MLSPAWIDNGNGTYDILVDRFGGKGAGQYRIKEKKSQKMIVELIFETVHSVIAC